jgi:hypothetical protein
MRTRSKPSVATTGAMMASSVAARLVSVKKAGPYSQTPIGGGENFPADLHAVTHVEIDVV